MNIAEQIVDALIEGTGPHRRIPVKVRRGGECLDCEFTGYYSPKHLSIGYPAQGQPGQFSHGILGKDEELLTPVPSYDEWEAERLAAEQSATPAKGCFWPTM